MGGFLSKKRRTGKKPHDDDRITDQDRAVLDLKNARDKLKRYQVKVGGGDNDDGGMVMSHDE